MKQERGESVRIGKETIESYCKILSRLTLTSVEGSHRVEMSVSELNFKTGIFMNIKQSWNS
jgi:hypothetical protein